MNITVENTTGFNEQLELLYSVVAISADIIFEYSNENETFAIFKNINGDFTEKTMFTKDFEVLIKDMDIIHKEDMDTFERFCDNVRSGIDKAVFEMRILNDETDEYLWYRVKMRAIRDEEHHFSKMIGKFENISDVKNAEKRLIDKAERDPLTKVYNKSTTNKLIKSYLRTDSTDTFDAFMIIDVDDFKKVNDTLGHLFGDSILVDLSQEMQDLFRSNDVVGRIGGDEFIVFLRGMKNKQHIESKANDICKIFDLLYAGEDGTKITGSLGIALYPQDGNTFDELYRKADLALYSSKRAGKSCYTFYTPQAEEVSNEITYIPRIEQYQRNMDFLGSNSDFDLRILNSAFDITDNGGEGNTLYDLLYRIGQHFTLSRVSVYNYSSDIGGFEIIEQWNGKYGSNTQSKKFMLSEKERLGARVYFDDNGIFTTDFNRIELLKYESFLKENDVKACISCGYFKNGKLSGIISFEECVARREWSIEIAKSAVAAAKVVFSHYLKINNEN